jgi:hypothetical protein
MQGTFKKRFYLKKLSLVMSSVSQIDISLNETGKAVFWNTQTEVAEDKFLGV